MYIVVAAVERASDFWRSSSRSRRERRGEG
jgi:hypothetical protein